MLTIEPQTSAGFELQFDLQSRCGIAQTGGMTTDDLVEAPGVESRRGTSVSISLSPFREGTTVGEASFGEKVVSVSPRLDAPAGRKVESEVHQRLVSALERWDACEDAKALRKELLELLSRLD